MTDHPDPGSDDAGDLSPVDPPFDGGLDAGGMGAGLDGLLEQAMQLQSQLADAQAQVAASEVEGTSGGGMVRVAMTGAMEVRSVRIDPACVDPDDVEVLEDLVVAALRDAAARVAELAEGATGGMDLGGLADSLGLGGSSGPGALGGDTDDDAGS